MNLGFRKKKTRKPLYSTKRHTNRIDMASVSVVVLIFIAIILSSRNNNVSDETNTVIESTEITTVTDFIEKDYDTSVTDITSETNFTTVVTTENTYVYTNTEVITEQFIEETKEETKKSEDVEVGIEPAREILFPDEIITTKDFDKSASDIYSNFICYYINDNDCIYELDEQYQYYLWLKCNEYDMANYYELILAQMYHESGFDISLISSTNDYGLMQINICNHQWLSEELGENDFLDPFVSIDAGILIMSRLLNKYDVETALVCYNRGESAAKKGIHSTSYSQGVLNDMNLLMVK